VFKFFRKLWKLYHDNDNNLNISDEAPTKDELKVLHKTIKKAKEDIENFSFNTSVSTFMICVNELGKLKCNKRAILNELAIILSPYAPHIAEELWHLLGNETSVVTATFPEVDESVLVENSVLYPVSFNGKMRFKIEAPADMKPKDVENMVLSDERSEKWLDGKTPKKVIVVPGRIVNIVL
jgi:leucyl-tRNA synthetase